MVQLNSSEEDNGASVIGELDVSSDIIGSSSEGVKVVKTKTKALATPVARNLAKN